MNIFVGNLNPESVADGLRKLFSEFGEVISAKVIMDNATGISRGFGFVEMGEMNAANDAIDNLDVSFFEGNIISVKEAKQSTGGKPGHGSSGGGGYRPSGGGGYRPGGGGGNYGGGGDRGSRPFRPRTGGDRDNRGGGDRSGGTSGGADRGYRPGGYNNPNRSSNNDNNYNNFDKKY